MHTQDFTELMKSAMLPFKGVDPMKKKRDVLQDMKRIEKSNNQHLAEKKLPDYLRTPTAEELVIMRQFAVEYKRTNKNASKREIRRATQKQFNIRIFR